MRQRRRDLMAVALVILGLSIAGCASQVTPPADTPPAEVKPIEGTDVSQVILTAEAVRAVGIQTEPVTKDQSVTYAPPAKKGTAASPVTVASDLSVIPMTALIYDPKGEPWTYTMPSPRTFVRFAVVIARIDGDTVYLSSGPPVDTLVVTIGAPELMGAEYGVGAE